MNPIPVLSTAVTFSFAAAVFRRYLLRGGAHLLIWSIGLVFYGLGTLTEVLLSLSFSESALKLWYLSGAILTAAWLGQGTLHLLVRKKGLAWRITAGLALASLTAVVLVAMAPITSAAATFQPSLPVSGQYKAILIRSAAVTALTILMNVYGTLTLVGGAVYSAYLFWRKRVLAHRMLGNILIAAGAMFPAMAGSFVKAGLADGLYVSELLGVILMFIGFLRVTSTQPAKTARFATQTAE